MGFWDSIEQIAKADEGTIVIQSGGDVTINGEPVDAADIKVSDGGVWIDGKRVN